MQFRKLTPAEEKDRDQIIFGSYDPDKYLGGYRAYNALSAEQTNPLGNNFPRDFLYLSGEML